MSNSLADQLLKAGVVDQKKAKKAKKAKHRQQRLERHGNVEKSDEARLRVKQADADRAARDRDLNRAKQEDAERKDRLEQIRHIVEENRIVLDSDELTFNFTHSGKIKRIYLDQYTHSQLVQGKLAIAVVDGKYDVVPIDVAEKITQRDAACVVDSKHDDEHVDLDDPYAEFKVPDDLIW